jgi:hypothetical protein
MTKYLIDRKRWNNMNIIEQMGNIYSEVGRSLNAKRAGKISERDQAIIRALDLFTATTEDLVRKKSVGLKEVLRARDQFLGVMYNDDASINDMDSIDRYFFQFANAARLNK